MAAEWSYDNTRILTKLFVIQVSAGNWTNTHLTQNAFEDVAKDFKARTSLEYTKPQLKNKWGNLKTDYNNFKKLKLKETGGGWEHERNTVKQDTEWWKKAKKDIPACGMFQKRGHLNEDNLRIMFEDITSDGTNHWNPTLGSIPPSSTPAGSINLDEIQDVDLEENEQESSTSAKSIKRIGRFIVDDRKKPKTSQVMQEQITQIGEIAQRTQSSFESYIKKEESS